MRKHKSIRRSAALALSLSLLLALLLPGCDALSSGGKAAAPKDTDAAVDITDAFNDALEETLGDDTARPADSHPADSRPAESLPPESLPPESLPPEASGAQASLPPAGLGDDGLVGDWVYPFYMNFMFEDKLAPNLEDAEAMDYFNLSSFWLNIYLSFDSNGTVLVFADEAELEQSVYTLRNEMAEGFERYFEENAYKKDIYTNMTYEEYLASKGSTMDNYIDELLYETGFTVDKLMSSVSNIKLSGTCRVDGSTLILTSSSGSSTHPFMLNNDSLMIFKILGGVYGNSMVFSRK